MPAKDTFHIGKKYLKDSHYTLPLGNDIFASSYAERIIIGPIDLDDGSPKYSKRAIVIPAMVYIDFVKCLQRAHESFQADSKDTWEQLLFKHSSIHQVVARYEIWQSKDSEEPEPEPLFKVLIRWNYKSDKSFAKLVDSGLKTAIDPALQSQDWLFLKRGAYLAKNQVEMLYCSMTTLLEYSYYEIDSKKIIMNFVDFVMASSKLRAYVDEKLKDYENLAHPSKLKILRHLLTEMFDEKKELEKDCEHYGLKKSMDAVSNKISLIFSLFTYKLKESA